MKTSTSLFLLTLSLAIGFFYTYPNYKKINAIKTDLSVVEDSLKQAKELKEIKSSLLTKYKSIETASMDLLKKVVPETFDSVRFVGSLNSIAGANGMIFSNVAVSENSKSSTSGSSSRMGVVPSVNEENMGNTTTPVAPKSPYVTKTISFTLTGSYENFLKTIRDLENSIQVVDIKTLSVGDGSKTGSKSGKTSQSSSGGLSFDVEVSTYSIK
jgi:Tfp pilus assembly protein PilO